MSAFKQLTTKDVVITPFEASKDQTFTGNEILPAYFMGSTAIGKIAIAGSPITP